MKKLVLLLAVLCITGSVNAQYYYLPFTNNPGQNPGGLNNDDEYPVGGGLATSWTTIRTSSATPAWSTSQTIPFAFNFNGSPVTNYKVSTTGILTFDVASAMVPPSSTAQALPSALIPNNSVCVWGLQGTAANDNVVSKTFGVAPNRQHWVFFTSYSIPGNAAGWTYWSIVLEETSNKIYIVDQRTNGTLNMSLGIQIDNATATAVQGSPGINTLTSNNFTVIDNNYYEFQFGAQPAVDVSALDITTSPYLTLGSNDIEGTMVNLGTSTITSFDLNYTIDGGAPVTQSITGISIAPLGTYNFTHSTPWVSTATGSYDVEIYATNPNGVTDQNTANDVFAKTLFVLTQNVQRNPFLEVFTSSTCPPCTPGNVNFHNIIDTIPADQHVYVKFQQDFPGTGDPYVTQEALNRRSFYAINSIPRMEIDGGWDGNANSFSYALYQQARSVPAQYIIDGTYAEDTVARTYTAKVRYSPLFDAAGSILHVVIMENTTFLNVKTNGETEFYQVMKKMLPDDNGTLLPTIPAGTWDSLSISYTFNGNYRLPVNGQAANMIDHTIEHSVEQFGDLRMAGWIEAPTAPFQVFQSQNFVKNSSTSIFEMSANIDAINIYPSPATDYTQVDISMNEKEQLRVQLLDASGRTVELRTVEASSGLTSLRFDVSTLASGVYHIAITDQKRNSFVRRIVVQ
jgi:Secretion system C-terminal sorting domain